MKKIKMMLLSLALLAVVGGSLAFKAKFSTKYCIETFNSETTPPAACSTLFTTSTTIGSPITVYWTTTPRLVNGVSTCISTNGVDFLTCNATTKLKAD